MKVDPLGTESEENEGLIENGKCGSLRDCWSGEIGWGRKAKACCCASKLRICLCGSCFLLIVIVSIVIAIAVSIANYPSPEIRVRVQQASLANLCASSWELNVTVETYNSDNQIGLSDTTVILSYLDVPKISLVVPGSVVKSGWNVHQLSLPILVDQASLVSLLTAFSVVNNSHVVPVAGWQFDLQTNVLFPVLGSTFSKEFNVAKPLTELVANSVPSPAPQSQQTSKPYFVLDPRNLTIGYDSFSAEQSLELGVEQTRTLNRSFSVFGLPGLSMPALSSPYWQAQLEGGATILLPPEIALDLVRAQELSSYNNNSDSSDNDYLARIGGVTLVAYLQPLRADCFSPGELCESRLRFGATISNSSISISATNQPFWFNLTRGKCEGVFTNSSSCIFPGADFSILAPQLGFLASGRPAEGSCALIQYALNLLHGTSITELLNATSSISNTTAANATATTSNSTTSHSFDFGAPSITRVSQVNSPTNVSGQQIWLGVFLSNFYRVRVIDSLYLGGGALVNIHSSSLLPDGSCSFILNSSLQLGVSLPSATGSIQLGLVLNKGMGAFQSEIAAPLTALEQTERCLSFQVELAPPGLQSSVLTRLLHQVEVVGRLHVGNAIEEVLNFISKNVAASKNEVTPRMDGFTLSQDVSYPSGLGGIPKVDLGVDIVFSYYLNPFSPVPFAFVSVASSTGGFLASASVRVNLRDSPLSPSSTLGAVGPFVPRTLLSLLASSYATALPFAFPFRCSFGIGSGFQLLFDFPFPFSVQPALRLHTQQLKADSATSSPLCFCSDPAFLVSLVFRNVFYLQVSAASWSIGGNTSLSSQTVAALTNEPSSTAESIALTTCSSSPQVATVSSRATTVLNFPPCSLLLPCVTNSSGCPAKSVFNISEPLPTRLGLLVQSETSAAVWGFEVMMLARP